MTQSTSYAIRFMREELNHVVMTMGITEEDSEHVQTLTEDDLYAWIYDKSMSVSYAPGNEDTLIYEWHSGKEYCEGEGERGIFDCTLETTHRSIKDGRSQESTPLGQVEPVTETDRDPSYTVDPTLSIEDHADRAAVALCDYDEMRDLLADLMHWCDERTIEFDDELRIARNNYLAELIS